jgi:hypothetical protein
VILKHFNVGVSSVAYLIFLNVVWDSFDDSENFNDTGSVT